MGQTCGQAVSACSGARLTCKNGACSCNEVDTVEVQNQCEFVTERRTVPMEQKYNRDDFIKWLGSRVQQEVETSAHKQQQMQGGLLGADSQRTDNTGFSSNQSPFSPLAKKKSFRTTEIGLRSNQVRSILKESFKLFRNIDLPEYKLKQLEDEVFSTSFIVSPRSAAKSILSIMDASLMDDFLSQQSDYRSDRKSILQRDELIESFREA